MPVYTAQNLDTRARQIVAWVAILNLAGFIIELVIASIIGSAALFADAADFLEDFLINMLVLTALGWSVTSRRKASYGLAGLILIPAVAALGTAIWKMVSGQPPEPLALSVTAILAMLINLASALLLLQLSKHETALVRGAWLAARNDVLANLLILAAGIVTLFWFNPWPDIMVGLVIGIINLSAAAEVFEQARAENPELELDDDDD
ncbi:Cation efflux family protein [Corynebacterium diphtheriae subsp. lausannense]|uniref:Cation transporter n=1 Tax=Corynebacterium belfantii TaxID=2014537 RepID=A0ABS0LFC7_9CORY|nr:cation transporter [Corynebacterium belfantii]OLN14483.1 cobalt transporter [Corynebacterium diphtheriae] [Corynebacterium diphtheriae subsp. lausannense]QVI99720.1 cation transporter [Corynebacterium diphtheriae]MBG9311261.1 cation transporter [Corynebacterium belfantii]MBG9320475.1 cation transporter [Corynebacterium belfantii]